MDNLKHYFSGILFCINLPSQVPQSTLEAREQLLRTLKVIGGVMEFMTVLGELCMQIAGASAPDRCGCPGVTVTRTGAGAEGRGSGKNG